MGVDLGWRLDRLRTWCRVRKVVERIRVRASTKLKGWKKKPLTSMRKRS